MGNKPYVYGLMKGPMSYNWHNRAKILCLLNNWETPKILGFNRKLNADEIKEVFNVFEPFVKASSFNYYWSKMTRKKNPLVNLNMELE